MLANAFSATLTELPANTSSSAKLRTSSYCADVIRMYRTKGTLVGVAVIVAVIVSVIEEDIVKAGVADEEAVLLGLAPNESVADGDVVLLAVADTEQLELTLAELVAAKIGGNSAVRLITYGIMSVLPHVDGRAQVASTAREVSIKVIVSPGYQSKFPCSPV